MRTVRSTLHRGRRRGRPESVPAPPDFVGVGAQKSGTSWWYDLLARHPQTHVGEPVRDKELHFFDRFSAQPFGPDDVASYHAAFARPPGRVAGEWTPRYMHDFWTLPLLLRAAPEARILVLLRDPVDRYASGVVQVAGMEPGLEEATIADDALARSRYGTQLRRLYDVVAREQVLVLQFERCVADPPTWYRRTLEFVGYDDVAFVPEAVERPVLVTEASKPTLAAHVRDRLVAELSEDLRLVAELAPELDLSLWPGVARR